MSASNLNPTPFLDNDESEAPIYPFFHDPTDERYTIFDFSTGFPDCTVQVSDNYSQSSMTNVDETRDTSIVRDGSLLIICARVLTCNHLASRFSQFTQSLTE